MSSGTAEIERKESCSWTATATATAKSYFETNVLARVNCVRTSNACNFCGTSKEKKAIQRRNWAEKATLSSEKESIWAQWHSRCTISITSGVSSIASCCRVPMILILLFAEKQCSVVVIESLTYSNIILIPANPIRSGSMQPFGYHSRFTTAILSSKRH